MRPQMNPLSYWVGYRLSDTDWLRPRPTLPSFTRIGYACPWCCDWLSPVNYFYSSVSISSVNLFDAVSEWEHKLSWVVEWLLLMLCLAKPITHFSSLGCWLTDIHWCCDRPQGLEDRCNRILQEMEGSLTARDRVGIQDFVLLDNYNSESAFLDNLRKRFHENLIYVSLRVKWELYSAR